MCNYIYGQQKLTHLKFKMGSISLLSMMVRFICVLYVWTQNCHYICTFNFGTVTISVQSGTHVRLINFPARTDLNCKQTNGLSLNGCNAVRAHCDGSVNCVWTFWLRAGDVASACCAASHRHNSNPTFHTGEVQVLYAFGKIAAALCKFTGTLTLICRVVAGLCTIIHVLLHQPSSSSYSLSSSFSSIPFIPYAFCVVSIYTPQCGAVSKVPTNIWQGRVKSTMKCDQMNRERESSKCGTGKQIQEITTSIMHQEFKIAVQKGTCYKQFS